MMKPPQPRVLALLLLAVGLAGAGQPAAIVWTPIVEGVEQMQLARPLAGGGQWSVHALRVDMSRARLDVVRAKDAALGLETVSAIAARMGAIAAINGGYFKISDDFVGDSAGTLQIDGALWSEPDRARASVGIVRESATSRLLFGHVTWQSTIDIGGQRRRVDGLNRARGPNDLVVFTPAFGAAPTTDDTGIEAAVTADAIGTVHDHSGRTPIPRDGFVISARGTSADWIRRVARPGVMVRLSMTLRPLQASLPNRWTSAEDILGGGPQLVVNGRIDITDRLEKMTPAFRTDLHPRTAIAALSDGRALLLVADGRHPPQRVGLSLDDLARLLIELGARDAINLDGGGSTTMVVKGAIVNVPSDVTGERPVSDAIVVRSR
jgi:hypothetical protein